MVSKDSFYYRLKVRTRLLLAFTIISVSAIVLAFFGWKALSDTENAIVLFEQEALPDVSRALELAERTANLAAIAPYASSASSTFMLQGLTKTLEDKIATVRTLAQDLPQLDVAAPKLKTLLERLDVTVSELTELTRRHLFIRADLRGYQYRLNDLMDEIQSSPSELSELQKEKLLRISETLLSSTFMNSSTALRDIRDRYETLLSVFSQSETFQRSLQNSPELQLWMTELRKLSEGDQSLFELRSAQLATEQRSAFLLASTRAISEQLSGEVKHFVDRIEGRISVDSQRVGLAADSGKTGIFIISALCIFAALGGVWMVRELARSLGDVTQVMSRLAAGDKQQQMPAIERDDELGDLVRAFQVFRENAVEIDRISQNFKEQSRMLETVFNSINDGLSVFDQDRRLVAWNPQYLSILELPEGALKRGMELEKVHRLLSEEAQESWALNGMALDRKEINMLRQMKSQRFERRFANGRVVEFRSDPMPDGGFVTLYSDLTERKAIEAQLRQSQKMEVLGQLTGGVAHDFNNLLAVMFGNLQLLEGVLDKDSKAFRYASRALASAERGKSLTQRLLAFSRKQMLQPEITGVDDLIEEMIDLIEYSVGPDIEIQLDLNTSPWTINVDPGQLENALLNLAINSSAAMPVGGTLKFSSRQCKDFQIDGNTSDALHIQVSDTGCGISEVHLRRVFEPFFTTKEIGEGSGLGLSMVYGFVKQSHGDIQVQSAIGEGTVIDIYLPRKEVEAAIPTREDNQLMSNGKGELILMVEDDLQVRIMGEELLQQLNYKVRAVSTAEEAIRLLEQESDISAVFTDINLGSTVNGLELAELILKRWPRLPVLLTSGLSTQHLEEQYGVSEARNVLPKPYRLEELAAALCKTLLTTDQGAV